VERWTGLGGGDRKTQDDLGAFERLGRWAARNRRGVALAWVALIVGLGALAPGVEDALSGAGWEATGSESVEARERINVDFEGRGTYALQAVIAAEDGGPADAGFAAAVDEVERVMAEGEHVGGVFGPDDGTPWREEPAAATIVAAADAPPDEMVRTASDLKEDVRHAGGDGVRTELTGAAAMWSDFNEANKEAMLKSELVSWPVTLTIMVIAFGSLIAAGLPLMLTIAGLVCAAGLLFVAGQAADVSIWAMNFALMFALALGIDYALFIVARFRQVRADDPGVDPVTAAGAAMGTAGKAVFLSGITVLVSLSALLLVPSPAFRSMALGINLAVTFVLAASLTLLPAALGALGERVDGVALPWRRASGSGRSARLGAWAERAWRRPGLFGAVGAIAIAALAWPVATLDTGMPSITVVPEDDTSRQGYELVQGAFGEGAPGTLQVVSDAGDAETALAVLDADPGIENAAAAEDSPGGSALIAAVPGGGPSSDAVRDTIDRVRAELPASAAVGGAVAENHDLEEALADATPLVVAAVLALGFVLLLVALRAPILAGAAVVLNVLATLAAFGVAKWIFQDGAFEGLLGFESQGFLNAWAPVFFFAMLFALGMDYTVFLLTTAKQQWDRSGDARIATVEGIARSGPVITAAAAVMIAVFFTFALSGPLPPKEMGIILGVAVLIDAVLVRLVLMPAVLRALGARAWWLPAWLDRALPRISFGH